MAQNRLDYRDALGLIANAETIVSFRRAIYEILKAIRFGGVYFLAPPCGGSARWPGVLECRFS